MPTLIDLPGEVITMLACELETEAFLNFRMTCKDLNSKSFGQYINAYFKIRYHMLDRHSLRNLLEISAHTVFGPALHTLEICIDHLTEEMPVVEPGTWIQPESQDVLAETFTWANINEEAYQHYLADQKRVGECGLDSAYLTRAIINLSNCKRIYVNDTHRPWGAASQKRQTGVRPTSNMECMDSVDYIKRTVKVVLAAIMASQISLDLFEISPGYNRQAMSPEMLPLWQDIYLSRPLSQPTRVACLSLMINPKPSGRYQTWAQDLVAFIELFPALEKLSLYFFDCVVKNGGLKALSTSLRLPFLKVLSITSADCAENDLATLFLGHKDTLREIELDCVDIIEGEESWTSLKLIVHEHLSVEKFYRVTEDDQRECLL